MASMDANLKELLNNINDVVAKIAERDNIKLPPVGGYFKLPNGKWDFLPGKGEYKMKDGEMQWHLD